ncbi:MAG: hypothetical protein WBB65_00190 [Anaerolineales bacterium]
MLTESGIPGVLRVAGGAGFEDGLAALHAKDGIGIVFLAALLADHLSSPM